MQSIPVSDPRMTREQVKEMGYVALPDRRDEAVSPAGDVAWEWDAIFESVQRHGLDVLNDWRIVAARISRERGLAYRPASVDPGKSEGWSLDPIPWVIAPENWATLEAGIAQRTRLYEILLEDVYGKQRLLKEGIVPAEVILAHNGYLRALHDCTPGEGCVGLGLAAFDIAKDRAGQSFVVNDRFDCPYGLGLALENRTVVNKVLPRLFRRCGVQRIGQFFIDWFENLVSRSPSSESRQVVILDSSEKGEDSEISFLANYCGIARVHPSDLTVRDGRVWIKSLKGLVPVDVIWKTMAGRIIDTLESEKPAGPGIAGLFEAIRVGSVAVASHPGSEVLQSPALYPYLPQLCRVFLGEELRLPPVATWWCGEPAALSHVLAHLPSLVIKPAGHHHDFTTRYASRLSAAELESLKAEILAHPAGFVGQEELNISTVPASHANQLVPRGAVLRAFSFIDRAGIPKVMPGGLARVSTARGVFVSTRKSGESKDVWICSSEQEEPFSIASVIGRTQISSPEIVASRTGENLFWTGRYAERTDTISRFAARILDGQTRGFSQDARFEAEHEAHLISGLFRLFDYEGVLASETDPAARLKLVMTDMTCPVGISYNLERFHQATQATWEEWSPASIMAIGSCYEGWKAGTEGLESVFHLTSELESLHLNLAAFLGLNLDSMTRDEAWALLDAGRRIERASNICALLSNLLDGGFEGNMETLVNESFLFILDSVRTFQSRFHDSPRTALTVRLLLGEPDYPRSIMNLLDRLNQVLEKLPKPARRKHPRESIDPVMNELDALVGQIDGELAEGTFPAEDAGKMIRKLEKFFATLSDNITVSYFSHANIEG